MKHYIYWNPPGYPFSIRARNKKAARIDVLEFLTFMKGKQVNRLPSGSTIELEH